MRAVSAVATRRARAPTVEPSFVAERENLGQYHGNASAASTVMTMPNASGRRFVEVDSRIIP